MSYRGAGNFGRGYALIEFILEKPHHTLRLAAKEFRISETTARNDIYRVGLDAKVRACKNPEKTFKMFVEVQEKLKSNKGKKRSDS